MTTWNEVQVWLRTQFELTRDELGWCGWSMQLGGSEQVLVAKVTETDRPPQLILAARVGERQLIDPIEALRYNGVAETGALVLEGQTYLLRAILPLADVPLARIARALEELAVEATRLRILQQAGRRTTAGACLAYLAD